MSAEILYRYELIADKTTQLLLDIDPQTLEKHIAQEELKLKLMHHQFLGALSLFNLQQKLIAALNSLLPMLMTPTLFQDIQFQLMKITHLTHEIAHEVSKSDRHQRIVYQQDVQRMKAHARRAEKNAAPTAYAEKDTTQNNQVKELLEGEERTVVNNLHSLRTPS